MSLRARIVALVLCGSLVALFDHYPPAYVDPLARVVWVDLFTHIGLPQSDIAITVTRANEPTWALFQARGAYPGVAFQPGYGFLHRHSGVWSVVAAGSALVGCPGPGVASRYVVPALVLSEFGYRCPGVVTR